MRFVICKCMSFRVLQTGIRAGMSIDMKFYPDIGGGHIDIESSYWFRKYLLAPAPN
jgi:hypothetical protein